MTFLHYIDRHDHTPVKLFIQLIAPLGRVSSSQSERNAREPPRGGEHHESVPSTARAGAYLRGRRVGACEGRKPTARRIGGVRGGGGEVGGRSAGSCARVATVSE